MDKKYNDNSAQLSLPFSSGDEKSEMKEVKVISLVDRHNERKQELRNEFRALSDSLEM